MNTEDEEFNRMEREAEMRRKAVSAALNDHVMHMRANLSEYERGVIDGRQMQVKSSVDKAVNALAQRKWVELTVLEIEEAGKPYEEKDRSIQAWGLFAVAIEDLVRKKNT